MVVIKVSMFRGDKVLPGSWFIPDSLGVHLSRSLDSWVGCGMYVNIKKDLCVNTYTHTSIHIHTYRLYTYGILLCPPPHWEKEIMAV